MKGLYVLKEKRIYKRELPLWGSLLAAVLLAGCITLLALWCQPNALRTVLAGFKAQPLLIVLNALPIGLLLLAFAFLFRNVFYSGALVNFFVCALSLANRVKIEVRDEPVFPRDFSLLREVGSAIQSYDIRYPVKAIAVVVLTTALLIGLGVLFPSRPVSFATLKAKLTKRDAVAVFPGRCWPERILGAVLSFGVLTALIFSVYASNDLYGSATPTMSPRCSTSLVSPTVSATSSPPIRWTSRRAFPSPRPPVGRPAGRRGWARTSA